MERLTRRNLQHLLDCLRELYAPLDLKTFQTQVLAVIPKVVPSEISGYTEVNPQRGRALYILDPPEADSPDHQGTFEHNMHEHPLINYYQETHDGRAVKISDFLMRRQFHHLALYQEFFRRIEVEHEIAITLPNSLPLLIGITPCRSRRDFSERERTLLNLLRPHLIQAYRNAEALTQREQELTRLRQGIEALPGGLIVLARDGGVRLWTEQARRWIAEYFGFPSRQMQRLPDGLHRWVRQQCAAIRQDEDIPPPRLPLCVEREGKRLVVRLITDEVGGECVLVLEEQRLTSTAKLLETLGLSRREAEVLWWAVQGKTSPEIATILTLSARTVEKHLEHAYKKLSVETRAAAIVRALEVLGLPR